MLYLCMLAPHFPEIRRVVQMLYEVRRHDRKIVEIEHALQHGQLEKLSEIADIEQHKAAYEKFSERCLDVAKYPCI